MYASLENHIVDDLSYKAVLGMLDKFDRGDDDYIFIHVATAASDVPYVDQSTDGEVKCLPMPMDPSSPSV
jgi:hypothetical protein